MCVCVCVCALQDFFCMLLVRGRRTKLINCRLQQPGFRGEKPSSVDGVCSMQLWDNSSVIATGCEFSFIWTGANCRAEFDDCRIQVSLILVNFLPIERRAKITENRFSRLAPFRHTHAFKFD